MGQAAALSGLIGLTGPLAIVLKPPPVTWLGLISANIGYFIYAPFLRLPANTRIEQSWGSRGNWQSRKVVKAASTGQFTSRNTAARRPSGLLAPRRCCRIGA